jgi:hypothetical protein
MVEQQRHRPSLLAWLLGRRRAQGAARAKEGISGGGPLLLDQVSSQHLMRLASDRLDSDIHLPAEGAVPTTISAAGGRGKWSLVRRRLLPLAFLGLGVLTVAGMSFGTVDALTDEDGLGISGILRLSVMALVALPVTGQGLALLRSLPGGRWLAVRAGGLRQRLIGPFWGRPASVVYAAGQPLLLDQVSSPQLMRLAPQGLGEEGRAPQVARKGRRVAGGGIWMVLSLAGMLLVALTAARMGVGIVHSLTGDGAVGPGLVLQAVFVGLAALGVLSYGVMALRGLTNARRRQWRRVLRRLLLYILRLLDRAMSGASRAWGATAGAGTVTSQLALTATAAATVVAVGFGPSLAASGDDGAAAAVARPSVTVTVAPTTPQPFSSPSATPTEKSPFLGDWEATDVIDGSFMEMKISGDHDPDQFLLFDDWATACPEGGPATAIGEATLADLNRLDVDYGVRCQVNNHDAGVGGVSFEYQPGSDTLTDSWGNIWYRVP